MDQDLKSFYEAWLAKHNAPSEHPHRELFGRLVDEIAMLREDANTLHEHLAKLEDLIRRGVPN